MRIISVPPLERTGYDTMQDACEALVMAARSNNLDAYNNAQIRRSGETGKWEARFVTEVGSFIHFVAD